MSSIVRLSFPETSYLPEMFSIARCRTTSKKILVPKSAKTIGHMLKSSTKSSHSNWDSHCRLKPLPKNRAFDRLSTEPLVSGQSKDGPNDSAFSSPTLTRRGDQSGKVAVRACCFFVYHRFFFLLLFWACRAGACSAFCACCWHFVGKATSGIIEAAEFFFSELHTRFPQDDDREQSSRNWQQWWNSSDSVRATVAPSWQTCTFHHGRQYRPLISCLLSLWKTLRGYHCTNTCSKFARAALAWQAVRRRRHKRTRTGEN